jgi:hypothetical protein
MVAPKYGMRPCPKRREENVKRIIGVILVLLSGAAYGQLFKCVDKSGRVEYASVCPPGTKQEATGIRNAPGAPASASGPHKSLAEQDAEFRKRRIEQQEAATKQDKKAAENAQRQRSCDSARSYLASLKSGARMAHVDPKTGEQVFLEDKDRARETADAQRAVDSNCK